VMTTAATDINDNTSLLLSVGGVVSRRLHCQCLPPALPMPHRVLVVHSQELTKDMEQVVGNNPQALESALARSWLKRRCCVSNSYS
jgi:hypothetical protein